MNRFNSSRQSLRIVLLTTAFLGCVAPMGARITKVVVENKESPAYQGKVFGKAGQFEILTGHYYGEIDPFHPLNLIINDIKLAPRNAKGMVEYSGTFAIAKPIDMSKASGVLFFTVSNRGNGCPEKMLEANCDHNVFAWPDGRIALSTGWQGDLKPKPEFQTLTVPIAKNPDGSSITGPVVTEIRAPRAAAQTLSFNNQKPATLDTTKATLSRKTADGRMTPVPSANWAFADCDKVPFPGEPNPSKVCVKGGFEKGSGYELAFTAKDPLILGIGYAATRDLNSFLHYAEKDDAGNPNPVAKNIKWVISQGSSQSGAFIRGYIHLGFNQDEDGRRVWDGANTHIAGRQLAINFRFAMPSGAAALYEPGSDGVNWWSPYKDEVRHLPTASMLDRCTESGTCPKIFETFGGSEFWQTRMSVGLVGTDAKSDIPLPGNVRRYLFPSVAHDGGRGGFNTNMKAGEGCISPENPNPIRASFWALSTDLIDWVSKGTPPPPSRYPRVDRGELVPPTQADMGFPSIPGVPAPDGFMNPFYEYDLGPDFHYNDLSGAVAKMPPTIKRVLPMLVPKSNADGNDDVTAVSSVLLQVPLATYLDWNINRGGGANCGVGGSFIPFAKTKKERLETGDPRLSLEERYGTHENYVALVKSATERAVKDRFLLREDADKLIKQAEASDVLTGE